MKNLLSKGLTGNQLKILAVIFMTIDHVGMMLFPTQKVFRIIGRLAFPIFAYTFAEGCKYTKNRTRHFFILCLFAVLGQVIYSYMMHTLHQNILVTLALSAITIYSFDFAKKKGDLISYAVPALVLVGVFFICYILPAFFSRASDFAIDYGFLGVMLPVLVYFGKDKDEKLFLLSIGLLILGASSYSIRQLLAIGAVPILALYNGKRGEMNMKYFFYIFYPLHLALIYIIGMFLVYLNIL